MQATSQPTILIIIGITGDLSRRYLLPAIEKIAAAGVLSDQFHVVGVTRREMGISDVVSGLPGSTNFLKSHLTMVQADLTVKDGYTAIENEINAIEARFGVPTQRLFYLSIPPQASQPVIRLLGTSGLGRQGTTKLLMEKPFGTDLVSADELIQQTSQYFEESQLYRIDHYLAKEVVQSLVVFRQANPLFRHTWNKDFIERIDIISSEAIGIEGRGGFYEQTGALRDVMQSHILQLAAITLMDLPAEPVDDIPERRLAALKQLHVSGDRPVVSYAQRGQYAGYAEEVGNPGSVTETYAAVQLVSASERWQGVPIFLKTGKALDRRQTVIQITYRSEHGDHPNRLSLLIQPDACVELTMWTKEPGYEQKRTRQKLRFIYDDYFKELPDAYEQVLIDALNSNHTLFTSSDEVRESWRILQPIQREWSLHSDDMVIYAQGSSVDDINSKHRPS